MSKKVTPTGNTITMSGDIRDLLRMCAQHEKDPAAALMRLAADRIDALAKLVEENPVPVSAIRAAKADLDNQSA